MANQFDQPITDYRPTDYLLPITFYRLPFTDLPFTDLPIIPQHSKKMAGSYAALRPTYRLPFYRLPTYRLPTYRLSRSIQKKWRDLTLRYDRPTDYRLKYVSKIKFAD